VLSTLDLTVAPAPLITTVLSSIVTVGAANATAEASIKIHFRVAGVPTAVTPFASELHFAALVHCMLPASASLLT
jgi:hypothetical protein